MAGTSRDLIDTIASSFAIPHETLKTYYRGLREAGMVTKGGRGISAAKMTSRDAAQLLIAAIGGSRFEKHSSVEIVKAYGSIPLAHTARRLSLPVEGSHLLQGDFEEQDHGSWILEGLTIPHLQRLNPGHTFLDTLTALIDAYGENAYLGKMEHERVRGNVDIFGIEIAAGGPWPTAGVSIDFYGDGPWKYEEEAHFQHPYPSKGQTRPEGDLHDRRTFSWKTIARVAELLKD